VQPAPVRHPGVLHGGGPQSLQLRRRAAAVHRLLRTAARCRWGGMRWGAVRCAGVRKRDVARAVLQHAVVVV
jgi:hypothetical protein